MLMRRQRAAGSQSNDKIPKECSLPKITRLTGPISTPTSSGATKLAQNWRSCYQVGEVRLARLAAMTGDEHDSWRRAGGPFGFRPVEVEDAVLPCAPGHLAVEREGVHAGDVKDDGLGEGIRRGIGAHGGRCVRMAA